MSDPHYWLVMPAAGRGQRLGADLPKQYLSIAGRSMLEWALRPFVDDPACRGVVIALSAGDAHWPAVRARLPGTVIEAPGGKERSDSVRQALETLRTRGARDDDWVLVHDAARPCVTPAEVSALLHGVARSDATGDTLAAGGILALPLADTLKRGAASGAGVVSAETISRDGLWRALTPQMFRLGALLAALRDAIAQGRTPTDEAQAMEWQGAKPRLIAGESTNLKVTTAADLVLAEGILRRRSVIRVGSGVDVHAFGPGDHVMLGGVRIAHTQGVVAHSDGDVVLHALCDALLGAAGLGDIGQHFPDSDPTWRGVSSDRFVRHAVGLLQARGYRTVNADLTLLCEAPRIAVHREAIRQSVAELLGLALDAVNLKATTTEKMGFLGRREGLSAEAIVLVERS